MSSTGNNRLAVLAEKIAREHEAATAAAKQGIEHAIAAGELLLEAKEGLKHGEFGPWLAEHCAIPDRTARLYMRLARNRETIEKTATVADLTLRGAAALLAPPKADDDDALDAPPRPLAPGEIELSVDDVRFRPELYPRRRPVPGAIDRYVALLPHLDAIEVNQRHEIIDGFMRWTAHKQAGAKTIRARITAVTTDPEHLMLAAHRNATHGLPLPIEKELKVIEDRKRESAFDAGGRAKAL